MFKALQRGRLNFLIWPPFGKGRMFRLRQSAISAAPALVWAGRGFEEFCLRWDQRQAGVLEPPR